MGILLVLLDILARKTGIKGNGQQQQPPLDVPQPVPPVIPEPEPKPEPEPMPEPGLGPQPFGPDAGPFLGDNNMVLGMNGVVWAPYEWLVLSETDKDSWPQSLLDLPAQTQAAIAVAQEHLVNGDLGCRVKGSCTGKDMANKLKMPVTRVEFVAYHLWLAAMQDGLHIVGQLHQVPDGVDEGIIMDACRDVAAGTLLELDKHNDNA